MFNNILQNNNSNGLKNNSFITLIYGGLALFMLYKFIKGVKEKKNLKTNIYKANSKLNKGSIILSILIVIIGGINIYGGEYLTGAFMIALVVLFLINLSDQARFSDEGVYSDSRFITWDLIKKWDTNKYTGDIVILYKEGFKEDNIYIKVNPDEAEKVDNIFRKNILNK